MLCALDPNWCSNSSLLWHVWGVWIYSQLNCRFFKIHLCCLIYYDLKINQWCSDSLDYLLRFDSPRFLYIGVSVALNSHFLHFFFFFTWLYLFTPLISPSNTFALLFSQLNAFTFHVRSWLCVVISLPGSAAHFSMSFVSVFLYRPATPAHWAVAASTHCSITRSDFWALLLSVK